MTNSNAQHQVARRRRARGASLFRFLILLTTLALAGARPAAGLQRSDSTLVAQAVDRFHQALASGDSVAALDLLAPDAIILESGDEESRGTYAAHHLQEDIAFARAVRSEHGPLKVTIIGDVAWVSSLSTAQGQFNGRAVNSVGAELMILSRQRARAGRTGAWKIRAIHWSSHRRAP